MKVDLPSITRIVALLASMAAYFGYNVPKTTVEWVSMVIFGTVSLYSAYKNNYLFTRGHKQKEVLEKHGLYKKVK
jgi:SPP1 family holin